MTFIARLTDFLWCPWLLGLFLFVGLFYSVRTGFFQICGSKIWLKATAGSLFRAGKRQGEGITRLQAVSTALASVVGTGSVAGVATAIWFGGPGAVFWMWISALLGMMTGCAEKILALSWRRRDEQGGFVGGPMYYIEKGMKSKFLATWFAAACVCGALTGGGLVQSNAIAQSFHYALGWNRLVVGLVTAALAGVILTGGIGRIAAVTQLMAPVMVLAFLCGAGTVLWLCRAELPGVLRLILQSAFTPAAATGGVGMAAAIRYGVARGVFTNEAGIGSTAMAHACADTRSPAEQGMWGMFEVFLATLVVCTATALSLLCAGFTGPEPLMQEAGVPMVAAAFSAVLGPAGGWLVELCVVLFAFSSVLGWSYYGQTALMWLTGEKSVQTLWRGVFLSVCVLGAIGRVELVWQLVDLCTALMALPNLAALLYLSPQVLSCLQAYLKK